MGLTINEDRGKEVEPSDAQEARSPVAPNQLWSIRIAALTCCLPLWIVSKPALQIFSLLGIWSGILFIPYVLILLLLGGRMQRTAFGVALAIGLLWVAAALPLCTLVEGSDLVWWVSVLLTHVALAATAGPAYYQSKRSGEGAGKWSSAITYPLFLAVLVMAGLIDLDRMLNYAKRAAPSSSAIGSVRHLVTSQRVYSETTGDGNAASLEKLYSSNLIDSMLASGTKDGYTFILSTDAGNDSFAIHATPITYDARPRSFYTDQTGVIRYTTEDRPATVDDNPLGQ